MISIDKLTKIYGNKDNSFVALDDISLEVKDKATIAIIGKSGSGKSTLMHIMSGLDHPTKGTVVIDKVNIFDMKPKAIDDFRATKMSFIFQSFFIEANQTCYQNVMLPLEIARVPISKRKKLVQDALKSVELDDKTNLLAGKLSGGQKQRVLIARALYKNPKILFLDEPTGNLDSSTGDKIMNLLFAMNKSIGCTIILVTHDHDLASKCQTQVTLVDGKIKSIKSNKRNVVS